MYRGELNYTILTEDEWYVSVLAACVQYKHNVDYHSHHQHYYSTSLKHKPNTYINISTQKCADLKHYKHFHPNVRETDEGNEIVS